MGAGLRRARARPSRILQPLVGPPAIANLFRIQAFGARLGQLPVALRKQALAGGGAQPRRRGTRSSTSIARL